MNMVSGNWNGIPFKIAYRYDFDTNDVNVNVENDADAMVAVNLLY